MQAAVLYQSGSPLRVLDIQIEPPRRGEVLVRVAAAGVCHSDYHVMRGDLLAPLPAILGHEGAGVVEEVGEGVTTVSPGDHVIMLFRANCGHCEYCSKGRPALCGASRLVRTSGRMMDGSSRYSYEGEEIHHFAGVSCFAEKSVVLETALVPIRKDVPLDIAALVGCSVMTGVGAVVNTARLEPGSTALVIGAGGVGLSIIMGAHLAGASRVIVADLMASKLEMARDFGATDTIDASKQDTPEAAKALTDGEGVDYAFEAIGLGRTMLQAFQSLRRGGTAVAVGVARPDDTINVSAFDLLFQEKTLKGSFYGSTRPHNDMPRLLELYRAGRLPLDRLLSRRYPLSEINEAYDAMINGEVARSVVVPGS
jgi:S-(hydroxymethyl)glutathione dehydrogenase / alcohol dehydrogenase